MGTSRWGVSSRYNRGGDFEVRQYNVFVKNFKLSIFKHFPTKYDDRNQAELDELEKAVGFSKVIRKLSSSRKLIVGHNMFMDLCFLVNQFVAPLPESLQGFKQILNEHLPHICDTKLMANTTPFKEDITDSSLEELLRILLQGKPFQMPHVETGTKLQVFVV